MFVTNWISTTKIQKISEITNFFRHYFLSRTEVILYLIEQIYASFCRPYLLSVFFSNNTIRLLIYQINCPVQTLNLHIEFTILLSV